MSASQSESSFWSTVNKSRGTTLGFGVGLGGGITAAYYAFPPFLEKLAASYLDRYKSSIDRYNLAHPDDLAEYGKTIEDVLKDPGIRFFIIVILILMICSATTVCTKVGGILNPKESPPPSSRPERQESYCYTGLGALLGLFAGLGGGMTAAVYAFPPFLLRRAYRSLETHRDLVRKFPEHYLDDKTIQDFLHSYGLPVFALVLLVIVIAVLCSLGGAAVGAGVDCVVDIQETQPPRAHRNPHY